MSAKETKHGTKGEVAVERLRVTSSPHIAVSEDVTRIMAWVAAALAPATVWSVWNMGWVAASVILVSVATCLGTEWVWNRLAGRPDTLMDGSALVTGLLLALALPPRTPWWMVMVAGLMAIGVAKMLFGGLGYNLFNPALVGRAFVGVSWAGVLAAQVNRGWFRTLELSGTDGLDAVSGATRLALAAADRAADGAYGYDLADQYGPLLLRNLEGSIGEVSGLLLILGGLFLIGKGIIDWRIPAAYIGTVAVLSWAFGSDPVFNVLAGGVLLGAFFMATDYVTSPISKRGKLIFGVGCGVFNVVVRFYGSMPEATTFAILFMNGLAPMIDKLTVPRTFGWEE